jgi:hypothetical protein
MCSHHAKAATSAIVRAPTKIRVDRLAASGKIHVCLWLTGCLKLTVAEYTVTKTKRAIATYGKFIGVCGTKF